MLEYKKTVMLMFLRNNNVLMSVWKSIDMLPIDSSLILIKHVGHATIKKYTLNGQYYRTVIHSDVSKNIIDILEMPFIYE